MYTIDSEVVWEEGREGRREEGGRDKLEQMWEKTFIVDLGKVDIADAYLFSYLFTSLK